jgi:hypothetical protein
MRTRAGDHRVQAKPTRSLCEIRSGIGVIVGGQASVPSKLVGGLAPGIAAGEHFFGSTVCANGSRCHHSQVQEHARNGLAHLCSIVHVSPFQNIRSSPEFLGIRRVPSGLSCRVVRRARVGQR